MKPSIVVVVTGAGMLGAAVFVWIFGIGVLDVRQVGWMIHGDSAQHYLGWAFFRTAEWEWPLGLVGNFGYPFKTTLAFTDSIPLVALPIKLLSTWLPVEFNYFGWWMAACIVGNAIAAASLLAKTGLSRLTVLAGSTLFSFIPCMMLRAYGHESLMAQGLLVLALNLSMVPRRQASFRGGSWLSLLAVCALVHPYFLVMACALFTATLVQSCLYRRSLMPLSAMGWMLAGLGLAVSVLYSLGYLDSSGKTLSAIGYPNYSANLLTWLDPVDWHWFLTQYQRDPAGSAQWSLLLPSLGQADRDQYEGFAYLGAGVLLLLCVALWAALNLRNPNKGSGPTTQQSADMQPLWGWPVWAALALMGVYALSTKLTIGSWVLIDLPTSPALHKALSIYRACGRFIWPLTYALMLWSLLQLVRFRPKVQWAWVLLALGLQLYDLSGKMEEFHRLYSPTRLYTTPLSDPAWDVALQDATHLVVLEDTSKSEDWVAFSFLAAKHGVMNSSGLISRVNEDQQIAWLQDQRKRVLAGQPLTGYVYVSLDEFPELKGWMRYHLNGWWILTEQH
jgi:hypothetical protein